MFGTQQSRRFDGGDEAMTNRHGIGANAPFAAVRHRLPVGIDRRDDS